jgi:hypothetical protein
VLFFDFKKVFAQTFLKFTPYKSTTYDTLFRMSLKRKNPYKSMTYDRAPVGTGGAETLIL